MNHNYLGFPGGIPARRLLELGRQQLMFYPVAFLDGSVSSLRRLRAGFAVELEDGRRLRGRTVVLCTGVTDRFPSVHDWDDYVGRSLFWCIVCDGYAARGKRVVAVGNDDEAGTTALQFLQFTSTVALITNARVCNLTAPMQRKLRRHNVALRVGEIAGFFGADGVLCSLALAGGATLEADLIFSLQGAEPNSALASNLGAQLTDERLVVVDEDQHTSVPGLFAAGDITHRHAHQVATAAHEGLTAATAVQHYLYEPWQK